MTWGQLVGRRRRIGTVMIGMQGGGGCSFGGAAAAAAAAAAALCCWPCFGSNDRVGIVQAGKTLSEDIRCPPLTCGGPFGCTLDQILPAPSPACDPKPGVITSNSSR